ncbi:MAG: hypothetical protein EZS28_005508 [Streblomastix strix]|uniref:SPRY domain-containing protein n=1 Tax=Streblomastix strix TaxID=222440 RepID=A0A5J4WVK6_9EUKA|nr:MAG: hypothetical protein EZS28_005508 [Streblomastix strix]
MSDINEYNVLGGFIGLDEFILLEIASDLIDLEDIQQLVCLNKKTFKLKDHIRFHKAIENKINIPISITVPEGDYIKKEDEFTYISTKDEFKTFPIDKQISHGIYRCEFKNNNNVNVFGVMKSGLVIPFGRGCGVQPYCKDNAYYNNQRKYITQNGKEIGVKQESKHGDTVAIEVNMTHPRTATFFVNGKQLPVFVSNLPESVQFFFFLYSKDESVTILSLKRLEAPTATNIPDAKEMKWE